MVGMAQRLSVPPGYFLFFGGVAMARLEWHRIFEDDYYEVTYVAVVPGGWLYRHTYLTGEDGKGQTMCFVPAPAKEQKVKA
jgi:hypothetical protein